MKKSKKWYSIIIIIVIIWFLVVLTSWVFRLIMWEFNNNRALWNYVKSYAWAESAQELALLDIKQNWYWSDKELKKNKIDALDSSGEYSWFKKVNDVYISFKNDWKIEKMEKVTLKPLEYHFIPLFYFNSENNYQEEKILTYDLATISWDNSQISWNVIWEANWISWTWKNFSAWELKTLSSSKEFDLKSNYNVSNFLTTSKQNYLQLFNSSATSDFVYTMEWNSKFTKPELTIISSWESGNFKTNIETVINLSDKLGFSKYSIYSN